VRVRVNLIVLASKNIEICVPEFNSKYVLFNSY
jgi:hypothetical protein